MASGFLDRVSNKALGEMLVEKGTLSEVQVNEALEVSRRTGTRLGEALVSLGYITRDALGYAIGEQYGLQPMELQPSMVDIHLLSRFSFDLLSEHTMLPLIEIGQDLVVVVSDPNDQQGLVELARILPQHTITPQLGTAEQIRRCLESVRPELTQSSHAKVAVAVQEFSGEAYELPVHKEPPEPETPQFTEWLLGLAAENPRCDVLIREIDEELQVSLTPFSHQIDEQADVAHKQIGRWKSGNMASVRSALLERALPLEHTRGQAALWKFPVSRDGNSFAVLILMPILRSDPVVRIRALQHLEETKDTEANIPLYPILEAGKYTVVLYDESVPLERTIADFLEENAASHSFVICQHATRCVFPYGQSYPAPFSNMVTAVQAAAATCVIFDHPVDYREATRLLTSTYPPPAVVVCAPMPSRAGGAGSLSPDVEELISRQGAQSVRLMENQPTSLTENTAGGND